MDADATSRTLGRLLARGDAVFVHFDLGLRAYSSGDLAGVARHRAAVGMLPEGGTACLPFLALRWRELWLLDRKDESLAVAQEVAGRFPQDPNAHLELGDILLEFDRPEEAFEALRVGTRVLPEHTDLAYEAGVAAERIGRWTARREYFRQVWQAENAAEPSFPLWLSGDRFVEIAEETLRGLPDRARSALGNVVVIVEDYPEEWIFETGPGDPRCLGLFDGPERAHEAGCDYVATGPSRIYLFRWNIERTCHSDADVEYQVAVTVRHEVGHYLGLDEDELHARGLG